MPYRPASVSPRMLRPGRIMRAAGTVVAAVSVSMSGGSAFTSVTVSGSIPVQVNAIPTGVSFTPNSATLQSGPRSRADLGR